MEGEVCLQKNLTGPTLLEMSGNPCGFKGSAQHLRAVYSPESESPKFLAGVDLDAARSCPVGIACSRKGPFSSASIVAADDWCFRWFLVDLGSRTGDGQTQNLHGSDECESLLLRSAQPLATRNQRKHQPPAAPIFAEENRPFRLHAIPTGQDRAASQSTPAKNFGLSDASK